VRQGGQGEDIARDRAGALEVLELLEEAGPGGARPGPAGRPREEGDLEQVGDVAA